MKLLHQYEQLASLRDNDGNGRCINAVVPWHDGVNLSADGSVFTDANVTDGAFDVISSTEITGETVPVGFWNNDFCIIYDNVVFDSVTSRLFVHEIRSATNFNISYLRIESTGKLFWAFSDGISVGSGLFGNSVLSAGTSYSVILTKVGNTISIYLNGVLDSSRTISFSNTVDATQVKLIGSFSGELYTGVSGSIFMLKRSFTADEVSNLHKMLTGR